MQFDGTNPQCIRLRELAERRHEASVACRRLASEAKSAGDRILFEEMARRSAEAAAALDRQIEAWLMRPHG
jgi:hypothetical protein